MTIIQPNKNNRQINFLISALILFLAISAVWGVFLYNQLVNQRHEMPDFEKNIRKLEVENAELKNNLYSIIDAKNLDSLAVGESLIVEKNPIYVKLEEVAIKTDH